MSRCFFTLVDLKLELQSLSYLVFSLVYLSSKDCIWFGVLFLTSSNLIL